MRPPRVVAPVRTPASSSPDGTGFAQRDTPETQTKEHAMKKTQTLSLLLACGLLAGCPNNDGPMEEAGETIDEAAEDAGEAIEDGAEKVDDAIDDAERDAEDAKRSNG
jgi:hypothetical protein